MIGKILLTAALLALLQHAALAEPIVFTYTGQLQLFAGNDEALLDGASFVYRVVVDTEAAPLGTFYQSEQTSALYGTSVEVSIFNRPGEADEFLQSAGQIEAANFFAPSIHTDYLGFHEASVSLRSGRPLYFGAIDYRFDQSYISDSMLPAIADYRIDDALTTTYVGWVAGLSQPSSGYLVVNPQVSLVPEPASWALFVFGMLIAIAARDGSALCRRAG